jgi:hypothetical protein
MSTQSSNGRDIVRSPNLTPSGTDPNAAPATVSEMPRRNVHAERSSRPTLDRAIDRFVSEIVDGIRHGYFDFRLTCDVIGHDRRRLVLHAGKSYQFVVPANECKKAESASGAVAESDQVNHTVGRST